MRFRTETEPVRAGLQITHDSHIFMAGSCFSDNISARLLAGGFNVCSNPSGTLYNPLSISSMIDDLLSEREFVVDDLVCSGGVFHSMNHHSSFSSVDPDEALRRINMAAKAGAGALRRSDVMILTFGTAWVYERNGRVVANCHKLPAGEFTRRRLGVDEAVAAIAGTILAVRNIVPDLGVILTVSPVRHVADGLHGNNLSKAVLHLACDEVVRSIPGTVYFPSFEMVNDDLRDYRFYDADMKHPSTVAVEYVYSRFKETFMSVETRERARAFESVSRREAHRQIVKT